MHSKIMCAHGGSVYVPLLGDNLLPEAVMSQRRSMRTRLRNLRDPVRQFRENTIPGPNVLGQLEDRVIQMRDRFVTREMALSRLQDLRGGGGGMMNRGGNSGSNSGGGSGSGSSSSPNGSGSRRSQSNNTTLQ